MDKSREYMEMCRQAPEIQTIWEPGLGDIYSDESGFVHFYMPQKDGKIKKGFGVKPNGNLIEIEKFTWLPRLNQLMEILGGSEKNFRDTGFRFFEWTKKNGYRPGSPDNPYKTLEQIWLAYVMEKAFKKKWTGDRWISLFPI